MTEELLAREYIQQRNKITKKHTGYIVYPDNVPLTGFKPELWLEGLKDFTPKSGSLPTSIDPLCVVCTGAPLKQDCDICPLPVKCAESSSGCSKVRVNGTEVMHKELKALALNIRNELLGVDTLGVLGGGDA